MYKNPCRDCLATALVLLSIACGGAEDGRKQHATGAVNPSLIRRQHQQVRERTSREFSEAAFVSPAPDPEAKIPLSMTPLIVQEFPNDPVDIERLFVRFGAVTADARGRLNVQQDQQTVYFHRSKVAVNDHQHEQMQFVWFYPPVSPRSALRRRGLRITLDRRGFPAIWEVLSSDAKSREVYVAKGLEQAAVKQYGSPLDGRRFVIEPSLQEQPSVVVPRLVGEGPLPMGPFVYLDADGLRVSTLICRCEPSQVAEFPDSSHYQLREINDLSALRLKCFTSEKMPSPGRSDDLNSILRLPSEF